MGDASQRPSKFEDQARRARAEARRDRAELRKSRLGVPEHDFSPVRGAEALTLVTALTLDAWSLADLPLPTYTRSETAYRFLSERSM